MRIEDSPTQYGPAQDSPVQDSPVMAAAILDWYDRMARAMPWRVPPRLSAQGHLPDPYHIWLSEVMLQQTTVAAVGAYFGAFVSRWPTVIDLAAAEDAEVMAA